MARKLALLTMEISLALWARMAFLRSAAISFDCMPKKVLRLKKQTAMQSPGDSEPAVPATNADIDSCNGSEEPRAADGGHDADAGLSSGTSEVPGPSSQPGPIEEPLYLASGFWNYVDDLLVAICNDAGAHGGTREEQEDALKSFFTATFQNDLRAFRGLGASEKGEVVTVDWQVAIQDNLMW
ncbi:hypothetical protein SCP_0604270 [Sparassis crispa]|uniref:Uncharacterized protein n=1 Tax=Sparassis crispa TaxID=139825 RepID=A0A401GQE9_9APHY|nr:hypothetical protein SCP_0604270 [Sparassis crispa]GBE84448.1 hypothetical protein SCP_0604270 [Sparassis crispa]